MTTFQDPAFDKVTDELIEATIFLFNKIQRDTRFSPSAKKFFYQFNLRDLSKITEGVMQAQATNYKGQLPKIYKLWAHESKRVIEDRLINVEDITVFRNYLKDAICKSMGDDNGEIAYDETAVHTGFVSVAKGFDKTYICVESMADLKKVLEEKLAEYNETKSQMNLVLFTDAICHVCKISRILDFPVGNALLIGVGGSGKQSLSKLAAFISGIDID
jgi:dynein heavy chain, axonemal